MGATLGPGRRQSAGVEFGMIRVVSTGFMRAGWEHLCSRREIGRLKCSTCQAGCRHARWPEGGRFDIYVALDLHIDILVAILANPYLGEAAEPEKSPKIDEPAVPLVGVPLALPHARPLDRRVVSARSIRCRNVPVQRELNGTAGRNHTTTR